MTKVLLVEDNEVMLDSLAFELEMQDYEVLTATDGRMALDILEKTIIPPDIIVSDIAMPHMDGYELLQAVQCHDQWEDIPFIFLTALSSNEDILTGKRFGADDYLVKPVRIDDVVVAIDNKLRRITQLKAGAERRLNNIRDELLSLMQHELRTPLTTIYGGTEMLAYKLASIPDDNLQTLLNVVRSGTARMNRLVEQVVLLADIDSGRLERAFTNHAQIHDMTALVKKACAAVKEEIATEVEIVVHEPDRLLSVRGLEDTLIQVVYEVVRNAVTYSPPDGRVDVVLYYAAGMVMLTVKDNGPGIPPQDLPSVWQRFKQLNRDQKEQQGCGLGLALVRGCIQIHDGDCAIESQPGEGTQFIMKFPEEPYSPDDRSKDTQNAKTTHRLDAFFGH